MPKGIYKRKEKAIRLCICGCGKQVRGRKALSVHPGQPKKWASREEQSAEYYRLNKEKIFVASLLRNHGLSLSIYEVQLALQNDCCAICKKKNVVKGKERRLAVDHDHACCDDRSCEKCFRGLLCDKCNQFLGLVGDSIEILESAIAYLKHWQEKKNDRHRD